MATQRLLGRLALAVVLLGVAVVGDTAPASAAACSGTTGVTVVIDNGSATSTRCASGDPSSAMAALQAVASVISPQRFQGSVVCRIDGLPSVADEPCVGMPPEKAYWAFFHASAGGSWTYSTSGVGTYNPKPGSVIGFRFGSGQAPRLAPPAATTPQPKPTPPRVSAVPTPTAPRPGSTGGAKATPAQPSASSTPKASGAATSATPTTTPTPANSGSVSATPSSSSSDSAATPAASQDAPGTGGGSPWGLALALLGVAGLGYAALRAARRRRQAG